MFRKLTIGKRLALGFGFVIFSVMLLGIITLFQHESNQN